MLAAMAGVAVVSISLLLVRALRARPLRIALVVSLTLLPALAAAHLPGCHVVHETVRLGSRDFAVATGWSLTLGDVVVLTERVKVTPLFEKFDELTAWQSEAGDRYYTISAIADDPAFVPPPASPEYLDRRATRYSPVSDASGNIWATRRRDPGGSVLRVYVGFDPTNASVVHATQRVLPNGRCDCVLGWFDLMDDHDPGSESGVTWIAERIADVARDFRGWGAVDPLMPVIPHDRDLLRAMDAANPWVRQSAERLVRAGTPEMYPESWRRMRSGR